ncbi:hypothetical protein ACF0H5_023062 [Mactra antiquata]
MTRRICNSLYIRTSLCHNRIMSECRMMSVKRFDVYYNVSVLVYGDTDESDDANDLDNDVHVGNHESLDNRDIPTIDIEAMIRKFKRERDEVVSIFLNKP